jgi:hypothetical protein
MFHGMKNEKRTTYNVTWIAPLLALPQKSIVVKALRFRVVFPFFLAVLMLFSCDKDDDRKREMLQKHDWEQLDRLPWDTSYAEHKFFHTLRFNSDGTYFAETNWSYWTTLMYTEYGIYHYDGERDRIEFPQAFDTITSDNLVLRIYLSPWQIIQINDTLLVVRSEPGYQPPDDPGGVTRYEDETLYFRAKD